MKNIDTLAYFLDEGTLTGILPDWPAGMNLVMCLDEVGKCELVAYHEKEAERVLARVAKVLGKPAGGFAVVPRINGYPTRKVLFSEEQKLLALVAEAGQLCEIAADYAINFTFADEEGLDPDRLMAARSAPKIRIGAGEAPGKGAAADDAAPDAPQAAFHHGASGRGNASLRLPGPAAGYVRMSEAEKQDCHFVEGLMAGEGAAIRLTIHPGAIDESGAPQAVPGIAFRDDFSSFVLPRDLLGASWRPGMPASFDIRASEFPAPLAERFRAGPHRAQVTITRSGIFVAPGGRVAAETAEMPAPPPRPAERRRFRLPSLFLFAGIAVLGIASGTLFGALQGA